MSMINVSGIQQQLSFFLEGRNFLGNWVSTTKQIIPPFTPSNRLPQILYTSSFLPKGIAWLLCTLWLHQITSWKLIFFSFNLIYWNPIQLEQCCSPDMIEMPWGEQKKNISGKSLLLHLVEQGTFVFSGCKNPKSDDEPRGGSTFNPDPLLQSRTTTKSLNYNHIKTADPMFFSVENTRFTVQTYWKLAILFLELSSLILFTMLMHT